MDMHKFVARFNGDLRSHTSRSVFYSSSAVAGLASADASTGYVATVAVLNVHNQATTTPQVIIPIAIRLTARAVNDTASDGEVDLVIDQGGTRYSSGGTELTPVTTSVGSPGDQAITDLTPKAKVYAGALTLAAATAAVKQVGRTFVTSTILAIGDQINIVFGNFGLDFHGTVGTDRHVVCVAPMWIGPNANLSVHWYGTAQAADPKFQFEMWHVEVGHGHNT